MELEALDFVVVNKVPVLNPVYCPVVLPNDGLPGVAGALLAPLAQEAKPFVLGTKPLFKSRLRALLRGCLPLVFQGSTELTLARLPLGESAPVLLILPA
jgi:hypothetical protein